MLAETVRRRHLLPAILAIIAVDEVLGAGCDQHAATPARDAGSDATSSDGALETTAPSPYASVTAVTASGTDGAYTLVVTIESADIDCTQYADFWEVVTPDGALVYRRILEHSHTDANGTTDPGAPGNTFSRDGGPVAIRSDQPVVVRAHMNNNGYKGQAMRGSVATGFAVAPDIAPTFAASVERVPPQPGACLF